MSEVEHYGVEMEMEEEKILLLSQFQEDLSCQRPSSSGKLWVLWSPTYRSSSSNSVGIKDQIKYVMTKFRYVPILIQFWAPVIIEGRRLLTTSEQPFALTAVDLELCWYRKCSLEHKFEIEEDLGFPARVFRQKFPELTPDIRYYSRKEHPWWDDLGSDCKVRELVALPVFKTSGGSCIGVLEIVSVISYNQGSWQHLEESFQDLMFSIEQVCRSFEAVDLKCSSLGRCNHLDKIRSEGSQYALDEIMKGMMKVYDTHKLAKF